MSTVDIDILLFRGRGYWFSELVEAATWSRYSHAAVLLRALRRLPHGDVWLPPEIRRLLRSDDFCDNPNRLIGSEDEEQT